MGNTQFQLLEPSPQGNTPLPIPKLSNQKPALAKNDSKWWWRSLRAVPSMLLQGSERLGHEWQGSVSSTAFQRNVALPGSTHRYGIIISKKNSKLHVYIKTRHSITVFSAVIPDHNSFFFLLGFFLTGMFSGVSRSHPVSAVVLAASPGLHWPPPSGQRTQVHRKPLFM